MLVSGAVLVRADTVEPNVLLVTVDTLRPDSLGTIGGHNATPSFDALAAEGALFTGAISPMPLTLPAHTSLLTGLLPRHHGVSDNGSTVPSSPQTLPEILGRRGYVTAAFVSGFPLDRVFGLDRGFDVYDDHFTSGREGWLERPAADTVQAFAEWLTGAPEPWFAWVHFYDPHAPYDPPRAFWAPGPRGAYDGEVQYVDEQLGRLLALVGAATHRPRLTVVTADHAEALGEHREKTHGYFVYDSTILVPLLFDLPARLPPSRSQAPARLVDVLPTVLDLLGVEAPPELDGSTLVPLLDGSEARTGGAFLETRLPWTYFGWAPLTAWRTDRWKLIVAPRPELYDLRSDPTETENLYSGSRAIAQDLLREMRATERQPVEATAETDPDILQGLRALGYLDSSRSTPPAIGSLPDPKDRIDLRDRLTLAEDLLASNRLPEAAAQFEQVLEEEPENRAALLRSGIVALRSGDLDLAVGRLNHSVTLDPDRAEARFALGDALMRQRRFASAAEQWMELARLQPARTEAWANLGRALCDDGSRAKGVAAWRQALARSPDQAGLWADAALCALDGDDRAGALQLLEEGRCKSQGLTGLLDGEASYTRLESLPLTEVPCE
jgi:choline-sulfatase